MIKFLGVEEHRGAKELLEFNLDMLRILGIWKWDVPHWRFHRAFAFLTIISLIVFNLTQICDAYIYISSLDHLTKLLLSTVVTVLLAVKNIYLIIRSNEACELINQLQNKFFINKRQPTPEQTLILNRYAARAKLYTIIRSNIALSIITFWVLYPVKEMLEEYVDKFDTPEYGIDIKSKSNKTTILHLPFVAYYPYDVPNNFLLFILTYLYQAFCGYSVFIGMSAWDMLFVSIFIHTSGHFKALQHALIHLSDEALGALQRDENQLKLHRLAEQTDTDARSVWTVGLNPQNHIEGEGTENDRGGMQAEMIKQKLEEKMQHILNNCIEHHQAILSFVMKLEAFLKPVMLLQLFVSMVAFCVICFQMSMIQIHTDATKFVKLSVSLVSALIEQGMFYWFGGKMLEESLKTLNAAYNCEWHTANNKFRKHLHILMERAKSPVKLTTGGFSTLTLESFTKVCAVGIFQSLK
ncbi:hypothetical protein B7P43_G01467 [Cryptotermes secundus]|uniref:Odorant receptor n=1 Tax=Cryptotermes secundus TaxID=105785 RepID=A0A2J7RKB2_9NEOP|nr:hypothetical protein B7P43_G01467 [Cryptotermes secundus]